MSRGQDRRIGSSKDATQSESSERADLSKSIAELGRKEVLDGVSRRDREILNRFYVLEQSLERICADMGLSYNQFRLLKSRAKARFGELGKRVAAPPDENAQLQPTKSWGVSRSLFAHVIDTFGSESAAWKWLSSDCGALGNRTPFEVIQTDGNEPEVERILDCIDYGIFA